MQTQAVWWQRLWPWQPCTCDPRSPAVQSVSDGWARGAPARSNWESWRPQARPIPGRHGTLLIANFNSRPHSPTNTFFDMCYSLRLLLSSSPSFPLSFIEEGLGGLNSAPFECLCPKPQNLWVFTLHSIRNFACVLKLRILRWEIILSHPSGPM